MCLNLNESDIFIIERRINDNLLYLSKEIDKGIELPKTIHIFLQIQLNKNI